MPIPASTQTTNNTFATIEQQFLSQQAKIEDWFQAHWATLAPPFYCSVDLRHSGFKLAPVDTNLFPAGFNNLHPDQQANCTQAIKQAVKQASPDAQRLLLLPESHTRNTFYFESLNILYQALIKAGFDVRIGSLQSDIKRHVSLANENSLTIWPLSKNDKRIKIEDFNPDLIILNNDLSEGIPPLLQNLKQPITPSPQMSWASRLKTDHFARYKSVAHSFAEHMAIDPWLISPLSAHCGEIDFMKRAGEDCLVKHSGLLLKATAQKYKEYGINQSPFVVIKANTGTYGMSVMMVHDIDELRQLNRKKRSKMAKGKGGQAVSEVIIQEGIYTAETITLPDETLAAAEPVIYMIGQTVVGSFYRAHASRNNRDNLNAPGMQFQPLSMANSSHTDMSRHYAYSTVARLALLSAGHEIIAK